MELEGRKNEKKEEESNHEVMFEPKLELDEKRKLKVPKKPEKKLAKTPVDLKTSEIFNLKNFLELKKLEREQRANKTRSPPPPPYDISTKIEKLPTISYETLPSQIVHFMGKNDDDTRLKNITAMRYNTAADNNITNGEGNNVTDVVVGESSR